MKTIAEKAFSQLMDSFLSPKSETDIKRDALLEEAINQILDADAHYQELQAKETQLKHELNAIKLALIQIQEDAAEKAEKRIDGLLAFL